MNDNNHLTVPGTNLLSRNGVTYDFAARLSHDDNESREQAQEWLIDHPSSLPQRIAIMPKQTEDLMMSSIERRLQQWLGDDAGQRFLSAPPIRRAPMPAANLEPPRLARTMRMISRRLMTILGIRGLVLRGRSTSSGY